MVKSVFLLFLIAPVSLASNGITEQEIMYEDGQIATVCGEVSSVMHDPNSSKARTLLNIGPEYPNHVFTVVILDKQRSQFSYELESLKGKDICVTGKIESYKGKAQLESGSEKDILIRGD